VPKKPPGPAGPDTAASDDPAAGRIREAVTDDDAFIDLWLKQELQGTFGAVVTEPVPLDLLRLIEEDRGERERIRNIRERGRGG